jgi:MFS family permease
LVGFGGGCVENESNRMAAAPDRGAIPRGVWALGFVSMFMDISSEMIHSLLPVFVVSVLGASAAALGLLEGVAESAVHLARMFSGALSDWLGKRKGLALAGYGLAALTKPAFAVASSYGVVFGARLTDRIGKGIRGAPRDALIAELTPRELWGSGYGLRQSLDTVGALCGPVVATLLMLASGGDFRLVFWIAVAPAFVSVCLLALLVHEPPRPSAPRAARPQLRWRELRLFPPAFWSVLVIGASFTLARFSEAFLILRAADLGVANDYLPLVLAAMNGVYGALAYPAGRLSDRVDRRRVLAAGAAVLVLADVVLARAAGVPALMLGITLWGIHLGLSQGLLAALVADASPPERRGTAFGLFNLVSGVVLLAASVAAGQIWDRAGAPATFYAGAGFAALAWLGLVLQTRTR